MRSNYRVYDFRLKQLIIESENPDLFPSLKIPRSTARGWIRHGINDVVTLPSLEMIDHNLLLEYEQQKLEIEKLKAAQKLAVFTFSLFGLQIQNRRLPHKDAKKMLLDAIETAKATLPLRKCLETVGLSAARFHNWRKRLINCQLSEHTICPRLAPNKLTLQETRKIRDYATSQSFTHFSITALSWFAKKAGDVHASASTWCRVIKEHDIKRPGKRIYPRKPRVGIRAAAVNQIWHLDLTILRLTDRSRIFIQSVIDNFSRFVLATHINDSYGGTFTRSLLEEAIQTARSFGHDNIPNVFVDGGSENDNIEVNSLITSDLITRTIARLEVDYSNSVIEAFFNRLKNAWLYLQKLNDFDSTKSKALYYVKQHNEVMPHNSLNGATPLEMYSGQWTDANLQELVNRHKRAITERRIANREFRCIVCQT